MKNLEIGCHLDQNAQYRNYMEDKIFIENKWINQFLLFGVFDGHGGNYVSDTLQKEFPQILLKKIQENKINPQKIDNCLKEAFKEANKMLENDESNRAFDCGSTGIVGMIYPNPQLSNQLLLNIANVGDSSGYLFDKKYGYRISYDHKASDQRAKKEIEKNNGQIYFNRVQGMLAITKAFGDFALKNYGVNCEPFTWGQPIALEKQYEFLVIASDGVWDSYSNDDKIIFMAEQLQKWKACQCKEIAKYIIQEAIQETRDNLSCVVIKLNNQ